jgi:hypothetical protein
MEGQIHEISISGMFWCYIICTHKPYDLNYRVSQEEDNRKSRKRQSGEAVSTTTG